MTSNCPYIMLYLSIYLQERKQPTTKKPLVKTDKGKRQIQIYINNFRFRRTFRSLSNLYDGSFCENR